MSTCTQRTGTLDVVSTDSTTRPQVHRDLVGLAGDSVAGRVPVAQPSAEGVRRDPERPARPLQRLGVDDGVVGATVRAHGEGVRDLLGGDHRREGAGSSSGYTAGQHPTSIARGARLREPLVLPVRHDDRSIGELDLVTGAVMQDLGGSHHPSGPAVGGVQQVPDLDLAHGRPARRRRQRGVERQRLPHRGSRRDDDHLARVQAVGEVVEVGEAGGHAVQARLAVGDRLDLVEDAVHDVGERDVVLARALVGDLVDLGLRLVHHVVDLALAGVADLHDLGARVDQPAQDRLLPDDLGVVAGVRGDRDVRRERVEVRRAPDALQLAAALELGGDGDHVDRLAAAVEVDDRVVDRLVGGPVEVGAAQRLRHVGDRVLGQQHRPEHGLLRGHVLRRGAVAGPGGSLAGRVRRRAVAPLLQRLDHARGPVLVPGPVAGRVLLRDAHSCAFLTVPPRPPGPATRTGRG